MLSSSPTRRVLLLETDERAGLVAGLTSACAAQGISLEMVTGPGHVLITFAAEDAALAALLPRLQAVPGVVGVHPYVVA
jgi:hypothetical protein